MDDSLHIKYLAINQTDLKWGLAVNSVGYQEIGAGMPYPPQTHPARYLFTVSRGRILNEYQLLYITKGKGLFSSASIGKEKRIPIEAGDIFLLFPGEWHSYRPLEESGWMESWIGFQGRFIDDLIANSFFSKDKPILNVGIRSDIADLYQKAISIASSQESGFQQALSGLVGQLLGLAYYYDRNHIFKTSDVSDKINKAKIIINDDCISAKPEEIAESVCMGYSSFRKIFKEYTGFSPAQYVQNVRINKAKEILTNTNMTIKEIAIVLGYENNDYFFTAFRKKVGRTPQEYRTLTQGKGLSF